MAKDDLVLPQKFTPPPGVSYDQRGVDLVNEALAYAEAHGIDFVSAVCELTGERRAPVALSARAPKFVARRSDLELRDRALEYAERTGADFVEVAERLGRAQRQS